MVMLINEAVVLVKEAGVSITEVVVFVNEVNMSTACVHVLVKVALVGRTVARTIP